MDKQGIIVGIAGKQNHGKDTVGSIINYIQLVGVTKANYMDWNQQRFVKKFESFNIHFADNLKDIVAKIYNIRRDFFDNRKYKDEMWYMLDKGCFIEEKYMDDKYYKITIDVLSNEDSPYHLSYLKHPNKINCIKLRTLLQYFGTDLCRNYLGQDIWVKSCINNAITISDIKGVCCIADVRFKEELNAIKKSNHYGGSILVKRDIKTESTHISENVELDCEFVIENNGSLLMLFYKVLEIYQEIINKYGTHSNS